MKTKVYQKPTTKVVKLQHTQMLMVSGEGVGAQRSSYGAANQGFNEGDDVWE